MSSLSAETATIDMLGSADTGDSTPGAAAARPWARQSIITDPGRHAPLFDALPVDVGPLCNDVAGLVSHYVASRIPFSPERLAEVDTRWVEDIVSAIVDRDPAPLTESREPAERFVGCCRDFTVLAVAALRHHGIPARSRVGFANYFGDGFWYDHVVVEHFVADEVRWVRADAQVPATWRGLDMRDLDRLDPGSLGPGGTERFRSASEVWLDYRAGRIDEDEILGFGASPTMPFAGPYFVRNYVLLELAHLAGVETLLWDSWGAMINRPWRRGDDHSLVDGVAEVLVDRVVSMDSLLEQLADPDLDPRRGVVTVSPSGMSRIPTSLDR